MYLETCEAPELGWSENGTRTGHPVLRIAFVNQLVDYQGLLVNEPIPVCRWQADSESELGPGGGRGPNWALI